MIQPAILAVLAEGPLHGYKLARRISEIPDFVTEPPDVSGIYRFLKTLESRGLVVSDWDTSGTGHAKKLYKITPDGKKCLKNWRQTLKNYRKTIESLLKTIEKAIP
jgi:DNA-binding PadR family transcriptional regulator